MLVVRMTSQRVLLWMLGATTVIIEGARFVNVLGAKPQSAVVR
jgi:hypothetical protein